MFWPYKMQPGAPVHYALCSGASRRFRVDLENGQYDVRVVTHMPSWTQRNFLVASMVIANGAPALLDSARYKGGLASRSFTARVVNGKIEFTFGGPTGWAVSAIVVKPAAEAKVDPLAAGAIRDWRVSPRYPNPDWYPIYQTSASPEDNIDSVNTAGWWAISAPTKGIGLVDLGNNRATDVGDVAYALAAIQSDKAKPVTLRLGASSQAMVWLNGKRVTYLPNVKGVERDEFAGRVDLRQGRNVLMLKLCRHWERRWVFYASVTE